MKAKMSIDPQLISLLGRKLYSGHPVVICVRELLQNSEDACKRAGVTPKISISITTPADGLIRVTCEDNGIGMTEEELLNNFLCLGGTNKSEGETGGFGIAKAALMSGVTWQVTTLDNIVSIDDLVNDSDIRKGPRREGTFVEVVYEVPLNYCVRDASHMIYGSDVDIKYTVDVMDWHQIQIENEHAGLKSLISSFVSGENWDGSSTQKIEEFDGASDGISGRTFIRLNGLVQFMGERSYYRESNLIVDVRTNERPTSKQYPFTISRERLAGTLEDEITSWISQQNENPLTCDLATEKRAPEDIGVVPGRLMVGKRTKGSRHDENEESKFKAEVIDTVKALRNNIPSNREDLTAYIRPNAEGLMIKLVDYDANVRDVVRDSKLITAWGESLAQVIDAGVEFGVGLIGNPRAITSIDRNNGILFFCLNPEHFCRNNDTALGMALSLWDSACHEVTHMIEQRHNERFCAIEGEFQDVSSDGMVMNLKRIAKILEGINEPEI